MTTQPHWTYDGSKRTIRNPHTRDVYHLQPWGASWVLSGEDPTGCVYWVLPDGRAVPREVRTEPVTYVTEDSAVQALQLHWNRPSHGRVAVPTVSGLTEAFVDIIVEVLIALLRVLGPYLLKRFLHEGCTPENVTRMTEWLSDPANEDQVWRAFRASALATTGGGAGLVLSFGDKLGREQLHKALNYLRTPEGTRIARSAIESMCEGGRKLVGVEELRVAPGVATRLAQRIEHPGCVESCGCVQSRVAADLRAYDRAWAPTDDEDDDIERLIERAVVKRELTVNTRQMWKMAAKDLYKDDDLVSLAVRESLQNSVDSLRRAIRLGKIQRSEAYFRVEVVPDSEGSEKGTLTFEDNGVGMNEAILVGKFLELGSTGKEDETESSGGFGMAKAAILGASKSFRWEIHTQDRIARSEPHSTSYDLIDGVEYRQGLKLTLSDVPVGNVWSGMYHTYLSVQERIRRVLAWSHVPDVALFLNGELVQSEFPARRGSRLDYPEVNWGKGVEVEVKGYKRADTQGNVIVRLNGLLQFSESGIKGMQSDILLEVSTKIRPGGEGYPFPPSRDGFRGQTYYGLRDLRKILTQESRSGDDSREYDDLLPDSTDPREREGAALFDKSLQEAADDPEIQALLRELQSVTDEIVRAEATAAADETQPEVESSAPAAVGVPEDTYTGWRAAAEVLPTEGEVVTVEGRKAFTAAVDAIVQSNPDAVRDQMYAGSLAEEALIKVEQGVPMSAAEGRALLDVLQAAQPVAVASDEDSTQLGRAVTQARFAQLLFAAMIAAGSSPEAVKEVRKKARDINPFGSAAMVKVSRKNFDPDRAKAFLKQAKKWMPHLVAWESILRLVHREGRIRMAYKPGFVLDDTVNAVAFATGDSGVNRKNFVLVNPYKLQTYLDVHRERPYAIANWLFTIACHEISHLPHMGKHHDEDFIVEREALQLQTGHLVPAMVKIIARAFKLPDPDMIVRGKIRDGRKQLRERLAKAEQTIARLEQQNAAAQRELDSAATDPMAVARIRRTMADAGDWDPLTVVDTLTALGRAEHLARWALSDAGRAALGAKAIPLARTLQQDPDLAMQILKALPWVASRYTA